MKIYRSRTTDPHYNLASEQYLLELPEQEDVFMLWQNRPSVIIGRNQNAYGEINLEFVEKNKIDVVRRLSGGGAVFHDLGNVNFTFITKADGKELDFKRFCNPIIEALSELGAEATLSGRNDILIDSKKISGNAQCIYNGKILHHGTLLFDSDMDYLSGALNADPEKIQSHGVKSVKSRVANIKAYLSNKNLTVGGFIEALEKSFLKSGKRAEFSAEDAEKIERLSLEKYSTWEWNFGRSGAFSIVRKKRYPYGSVEINLNAKRGEITDIKISGDYFGCEDTALLEARLLGVKFTKEAIGGQIGDIGRFIMGADADDILNLLF